jgi:hypothetical protein
LDITINGGIEMSIRTQFIFLAVLVLALVVFTGCDEAAEEALEEATGLNWDLDGDESDAPSVNDWKLLFAVEIEEEAELELIEEDFEFDISFLEDLGLDLGDIDYQVVFAKIDDVDGESRLKFATKVKVDDGKIMIDQETVEKLGASAGAAGTGWYGCYFATKEFGFVNGTVVDCDGGKVAGVLAVASDGPFFTYSGDGGSWALPSEGDKPVTVYFSEEDSDCSGSSSDPVTDEDNPKSDDPEDTPDQDPFSDDTDNVDAGEDEMDDAGGGSDSLEHYDFEAGMENFACTGTCAGTSDEEYGTFFPDGAEANYLYMTSGGSQNTSCTCSAAFQVPEGASEFAVSFDFMSQEWEEWAYSAYNDIFTAIIQGEFDYVINRTIDDVATNDDWATMAIDTSYIASSADADYNGTGKVFDGHLKWAAGDSAPRGGPEDDYVGTVATYPVTAGSTITVLFTVSDVGDKIYDTAAVIDWVEFR